MPPSTGCAREPASPPGSAPAGRAQPRGNPSPDVSPDRYVRRWYTHACLGSSSRPILPMQKAVETISTEVSPAMRILARSGTVLGVLCVVAAVLLSLPGTRVVRAEDEPAVCSAAAQGPAGASERRIGQELAARLAAIQAAQERTPSTDDEVIILNGHGYNYGPGPGMANQRQIELELQREGQ